MDGKEAEASSSKMAREKRNPTMVQEPNKTNKISIRLNSIPS